MSDRVPGSEGWGTPQPPPPSPHQAPGHMPGPPPPGAWGQADAPGFVSPGGVPATGVFGPTYATATGLATSSMVLGIVGLCTVWCIFLAPILAVIGLPLGGVALSRINNGTVRPEGRGQAIAGIVLCSITLVLSALIFILLAI